ncbi:hypothetical protein PIB30_081640 [Stylosanthes scabra]|uniref:Uncharacterized protein n=1 Tax=Stylosanthes scabra TaxID=79078 RepID=A0ABU6SS08_9FABA|nr:hypothetical protein [Stylosanthes scabra]
MAIHNHHLLPQHSTNQGPIFRHAHLSMKLFGFQTQEQAIMRLLIQEPYSLHRLQIPIQISYIGDGSESCLIRDQDTKDLLLQGDARNAFGILDYTGKCTESQVIPP